jgi:hypothetical protein
MRTRTCDIFLDDEGILHVRLFKAVEIDEEDAIDNFLVVKHLTQGKAVLKLVDARERFVLTEKVMVIVRQENNAEKHIAKAILVQSFMEKQLLQFFTGLTQSPFPVKIFTSEEKALAWLRTFLNRPS